MMFSSGQSHLDSVSIISNQPDLQPELCRHVSRVATPHRKLRENISGSPVTSKIGSYRQEETTYIAVTVMLGMISETVLVMVRGGSVVVEMNETRVVRVVTAWVGTVRVSTDEVPGTAKEVVTYGRVPGWVVSWHS
jgi:hypothetical protein